MRQLTSKLNKPVVAVLVMIIVGVFYFWNHQQTTHSPSSSDDVASFSAAAKDNDKHAGAAALAHVADSSADNSAQKQMPAEAVQNLNENEFKTWVQSESKSLNNASVDADQKQIQMKALALSLKPAQFKTLTEISLDTEADVNARIFSAYLITQNSANENQQYLTGIAKKSLPDLGPINPHSVAEIKRGQELALRLMAIDELVLRAKTSPEALAQLQRLSSEAESSEVRRYVQRKLAELR